MKNKEIKELVEDINKQCSDFIAYPDFVEIMTPRMKLKDTKEEIYKIFQIFDNKNQGKLNYRHLKRIA
jgi:centrin-1